MKSIVKTYDCGLRLIVTPMKGFKSVSTAILVGAGSRDEEAREHGLSHFVEHMLFKGTKTRKGEQIAETLSGLGVEYNAFTSTNVTCYYTRGLAGNVDTCTDILSDMYFNLKFDKDEFVREAEVIVQEIAMREDHPRLALGELCSKTFYEGTKYGHDIAGTKESVRAFVPNDIYAYIKKHYVAPKTIVAFAGDITQEVAEKLVQKYFLPNFTGKAKPCLQETLIQTHVPVSQVAKNIKEIEQQNVAILFPIMNTYDDDKHKFKFVSDILTRDMSSRLFVNVREKLGLVYSISGGTTHTDIGGYFYISFSCTDENTSKVIETVASELAKIKKSGVTDMEVSKVRNICTARTMYRGEQVEGTNIRNAQMLHEFNYVETIEEYLDKINKVTRDDVLSFARKYLNPTNAIIAVVGRALNFDALKVLEKV